MIFRGRQPEQTPRLSIKRTPYGYSVRITADNPNAAFLPPAQEEIDRALKESRLKESRGSQTRG